jgi:hypothetical protein
MNVVDFSPTPYNGGKLNFGTKISAIMSNGFGWTADMKSQEIIITALQKFLDNRYYLLRNIPLPKSNAIIPLLFFGPHGVMVFSNHALRGVYRATDDRWEVMDKKTLGFVPTRLNLITLTDRLVFQLERFFNDNSITIAVEPFLVFTDNGMHVETERPDIRILLFDAFERFTIRLSQAEAKFSAAEVLDLYGVITTALEAQQTPVEEVIEDSGPGIGQAIETRFDQLLAPFQSRFNFQRKQWVLLTTFVIFDIVVLLVFLIFIVFTA